MNQLSNPAFKDELFNDNECSGTYTPMTIHGTCNKTLFLLFLAALSALVTVRYLSPSVPLILSAVTGAFVIGFATSFRIGWSRFTAPAFALFEGIFLGAFSGWMESLYPGIVAQAIALTFFVFILLLLVFRAGLIRVTERFRLVVIGATGAIALFYLAAIVLAFFGIPVEIVTAGGWPGIAISIVIVIVASLSLVLNFDNIRADLENGLPERHEWYAAFTLLVTLIWLFLEILRLLAKVRMMLPKSGI